MAGRNRTISLLYEAAVNPSLWPSALAAFADLTQCRDVILSVIDKKRGRSRLFLSGSRVFPPEALRAYRDYYYKVDPLLHSAAATRPTGTLLLSHEYVSPEVAARNESYQDLLIPLGARYLGGWNLENNEATLAAVSMLARDAPFERKKVARWGIRWRQHARQAVALSLQLAERMSQAAMLRQAIDSVGFVCVMVDNESKLIDCSSAGAALLACGGLLGKVELEACPATGFRNGDQAIASIDNAGVHRWWRGIDAGDQHCQRQLLHDSDRARRRVNRQSL